MPAADLDVAASWAGAAAVIVGAPFDGGTSHRAGCRFGPLAIRTTDYLPHDGQRPHLALGVEPLTELGVVDVGDVEMPSGETERSIRALEEVVATLAAASTIPVVLGGDHTIALPDVTGVARHVGFGNVSVLHFDAHADTGDTQLGLAVRARHADAAAHRVRRVPRGPVHPDRACAATGPSPRRSRGWPTSGCAASR